MDSSSGFILKVLLTITKRKNWNSFDKYILFFDFRISPPAPFLQYSRDVFLFYWSNTRESAGIVIFLRQTFSATGLFCDRVFLRFIFSVAFEFSLRHKGSLLSLSRLISARSTLLSWLLRESAGMIIPAIGLFCN